jgi:phage/plasmid primase-like uncharacterized protein
MRSTTMRMARTKVLMSLMGTTRPIRHSTGGTASVRRLRKGAEAFHIHAIGDVAGAFGWGAVLQLALAVGLVQGHDMVAGLVGEVAQVLEKTYPELAVSN